MAQNQSKTKKTAVTVVLLFLLTILLAAWFWIGIALHTPSEQHPAKAVSSHSSQMVTYDHGVNTLVVYDGR